MLDFADELARPLANVVLAIARVVRWLAWEFPIGTAGLVCRQADLPRAELRAFP
jgi:hypothetical protein